MKWIALVATLLIYDSASAQDLFYFTDELGNPIESIESGGFTPFTFQVRFDPTIPDTYNAFEFTLDVVCPGGDCSDVSLVDTTYPDPSPLDLSSGRDFLVLFDNCYDENAFVLEFTFEVTSVDPTDYVFSIVGTPGGNFGGQPGIQECDGTLLSLSEPEGTLTLNPSGPSSTPIGLARSMRGVPGRPDRALVDVVIESFADDPVRDVVVLDALDVFGVATGKEQIVTSPTFVSGGDSLVSNPDFSLRVADTINGPVITSDETLISGGALLPREVARIRYEIEIDFTIGNSLARATATGTFLGEAVGDDSVAGDDPDPDADDVPDEAGDTSFSNADGDNDGVIDELDACPAETGAPFDRDLDGCVDELVTLRSLEYWDDGAFPVPIVVSENGASGIGDSSDFTAIQNALTTWNDVAESRAAFAYAGTTSQTVSSGLDGVNLVTFEDDVFLGPSVLAVAVTTSFTSSGFEFEGLKRREGEIIDLDLIFNPTVAYRTDSDGPADAPDLQGVATHELGHGLGISHSVVPSATMFFVLPGGLASRSLENDDVQVVQKVAPDSTSLVGASRLHGKIVDLPEGGGSLPVPGVAAFAISATTGDTLACDYSFFDGGFDFRGLPPDDYFVDIHPVDGSERIGFMTLRSVNPTVELLADPDVIPESWNVGDSFDDEEASPGARDAIPLGAGGTQFVTIVAEQDRTAPTILDVAPDSSAVDVPIDAAVQIRFGEALDDASLSGNFRLEDGVGEFVPGRAFLYEDDSLLSFLPAGVLEFGAQYTIVVDPEVTDVHGNPLGAELRQSFTTQARPAVALDAVTPTRAPRGTLVALAGEGFDAEPTSNTVRFGAESAVVVDGNAGELVVRVPDTIVASTVPVTVEIGGGATSNPLSFTVLDSIEVPRGFPLGEVALADPSQAIALDPSGARAYLATVSGLVTLDLTAPGAPVVQGTTPTTDALTDVMVTADGSQVFAVSSSSGRIARFQTEPSVTLLSEVFTGQDLRGIVPDRAGRRAYVPTASGILIRDTRAGSATFDQTIGVLESPRTDLTGRGVVDPTGRRLLVLAASGDLLVYDLALGTLEAEIGVGLQPNGVTVDPQAVAAFVTLEESSVAIVSLTSLEVVGTTTSVGALVGATTSPSGSFLYAANRQLQAIDVFDLRPGSRTGFQLVSRVELPFAPERVRISADGAHLYSTRSADARLSVAAVGVGPIVLGQSSFASPVGGRFVLTGRDFDTAGDPRVRFGMIDVAPSTVEAGRVVVEVPAEATNGDVTVVDLDGGAVVGASNAVSFQVLDATSASAGRDAQSLPALPDGAAAPTPVVTGAARARALVAADAVGGVHVFDVDPSRSTVNAWVGSTTLSSAVSAIDGPVADERVYAALASEGAVDVLRVPSASPGTIAALDRIDVSADVPSPDLLAVADDGTVLLVASSATGDLAVVDVADGAAGAIVASSDLTPGAETLTAIAIDPATRVAYVLVDAGTTGSLEVIDLDRAAPTFGTVVQSVALGTGRFAALDFAPSGDFVFVAYATSVEPTAPRVLALDTSTPTAPTLGADADLSTTAAATGAFDVLVSPRGDRVWVGAEDGGLREIAFDASTAQWGTAAAATSPDPTTGPLALVATSTGDPVYVFAPSTSTLLLLDGTDGLTIVGVDGDQQSLVIGTTADRPLFVRVDGVAGPVENVAVRFDVIAGDAVLAATSATTQVVLTDADGLAAVGVTAGAAAGAITIAASAAGLAGSPVAFSLTAVEDPEALPLELLSVVPADQATGVSASTSVQAVFSRAVVAEAVADSTIGLFTSGSAVAVDAVVGRADEGRVVSLDPTTDLVAGSTYEIRITGELQDTSGGFLVDPDTTNFQVAAAPTPRIVSVNPPSGLATTLLTVQGEGFAPGLNRVVIGTRDAVILDESTRSIACRVPFGALSNEVVVVADDVATDPATFLLLDPQQPIENQLVEIGTGFTVRAFAITPDGGRAYGLVPESDLVVPIDLDTFESRASIRVGDRPVSIVIDPAGQRGYVVNASAGTITVLDVDPTSPTYETVRDEIPVGVNPVDIAITPSGDRAYVIRFTLDDENLSILDTDTSSGSYGTVLTTAGTRDRSRTVVVTPDGGRLYVGTDDGYSVFDALSPGDGALRTVSRGKTTQQIVVSPDGGLLVVLDTEGQIDVYDVTPGSPREDIVIATVGDRSRSRGVAVTPDGGLLYALDADTNELRIYDLDAIVAGVSLVAAAEGTLATELPLLATRATGADPAVVVVDPTGAGRVFVSTPGDQSISVIGTTETATAVDPLRGPLALRDVRIEVDGGDARLQFEIDGVPRIMVARFRILRAEGDGPFMVVGDVGKDLRPRRTYEWRDVDVRPNVDYRYRIESVPVEAAPDEPVAFGPFDFRFTPTFALGQNYPNVFNPRTTIEFSLPARARTKLVVYDVRGRRVRTLVDEVLAPDVYRVTWDGTDGRGRAVASGVYFYRLDSGGLEETRKMTLVR